MNKPDNNLLEIGDNLEKLNQKLNFLQDSILKIQNEFEVMRKSEIKKSYFSKLFLLADKNKSLFLQEKAQDCEIADACSLALEKCIYEVLCTFNEKGPDKAIKLIDSIFKASKLDPNMKKCNDSACLKNYVEVFKTLRELINDSRDIALRYAEELRALNKESIFKDGVEDEIYNLITPLSNEIRLKILTGLRKGGKTYSQLEKGIGIKGGHLIFHLEKLINGGYVTQERKNYILTLNGLKVLKLLFELREELFTSLTT